jgi:hypothetical protein
MLHYNLDRIYKKFQQKIFKIILIIKLTELIIMKMLLKINKNKRILNH